MAGLDDFAKRITRISVQVEHGVERAVRDCAQAVTKTVVEATPVDTGKAKSNWIAQLDESFQGEVRAHAPGAVGSTGEANAAAAIEQAAAVIEGYDIDKNRSIHISNNLPYIGPLNDGHSKQAPAAFVQMAVMDGLATVRGAKILRE